MLEIWTFMGVKMAITNFVMQFTHVSRHVEVYNRERKKMFRKNCFENMVSDLNKKIAYVSTEQPLEKVQKKREIINK